MIRVSGNVLQINVRENRRGQSSMDNPETLATYTTHDEDKQIKNTTQKTKNMFADIL